MTAPGFSSFCSAYVKFIESEDSYPAQFLLTTRGGWSLAAAHKKYWQVLSSMNHAGDTKVDRYFYAKRYHVDAMAIPTGRACIDAMNDRLYKDENEG